MKKSILLVAMVGMSGSAFSATLESLTKEQFVKAFVNKTSVSIPADVFSGQSMSNTFSLYLDDKGHMKGRLAVKPKNEPQVDEGVYTIEADGTGYFTWNHWYNKKKLCFQLFEAENAYISLECDKVFHTVYLKNSIKAGEQI
jgi:hypothetical protein